MIINLSNYRNINNVKNTLICIFILLLLGCSNDIQKNPTGGRQIPDSLTLITKENELFDASIKLAKYQTAGDSANYEKSRLNFRKALRGYLLLKEDSTSKLIHLENEGTTIIIPVKKISEDSIFSLKTDDSVFVQWKEIGTPLKGEILDLTVHRNNVIALFADSISIIKNNEDKPVNTSHTFNLSREKITVSQSGLFLNNSPTQIPFLTTKLNSPLVLRFHHFNQKDINEYTIDTLGNTDQYTPSFHKENGLIKLNRDRFKFARSIRKIPGSMNSIMLDEKGYLYLVNDKTDSLLWVSERPWGNRIFLLDTNTAVVTTGYDSSFTAFKITNSKLTKLGKSYKFDGIVSAVSKNENQMIIAVVNKNSKGTMHTSLYSIPENLLHYDKSRESAEPLYPKNNIKLVFAPGEASDLMSRDWHTEIHSLVWRNIYETLFAFDKNKNIIPVLVSSYNTDSSYTKWQFNLKENIYFHDGSLLNSSQLLNIFRENIKNAARAYPGSNWLWRDIEGVNDFIENKTDSIKGLTETDSLTILIKLNKPVPNFLENLTNPIFGVYKKRANRVYPLGTGPFQIKELQKDQAVFSISLKRNPYYHEIVKPVEELIFAYRITDPLDFIVNVSGSGGIVRNKEILNYFRKISTVNTIPAENELLYFAALNPRSDALNNIPCRKKIIDAINKDEIARFITNAECSPTDYLVTGVINYNNENIVQPCVFQNNALTIHYNTEDPVAGQAAERISLFLTSQGIPHNRPAGVSGNSLKNIIASGNYDIVIDSFLPIYKNDVYNLQHLLARGYETGNQVENILGEAIRSPDKAKAVNIEQKLIDNFIFYPLFFSKFYFVFPQELKGLENFDINTPYFSELWLPIN